MRNGYHPKMLMYALDELFYIYVQIKNSQRDEKVVLAYEILCISANRCTDRHNGIEKTGVPNALALLNIKDAQHLEHFMWAVYDGTLLVGLRPKLLGTIPGVLCWLCCSDTSTGAVMVWPIARHRR